MQGRHAVFRLPNINYIDGASVMDPERKDTDFPEEILVRSSREVLDTEIPVEE